MTLGTLYGRNRQATWAVVLVVLVLSTNSQLAGTVSLPVRNTFNADPVDELPRTGGPDQPTRLYLPQSGTLLVRLEANGINTQPLEVVADGSISSGFGGVAYDIEPVTTGVLRVEATVALDRLVNSAILETSAFSRASSTLRVRNDGDILGSNTVVGTYQAGTPFRVRIDVDMHTTYWSVAIDDEMDGFGDDEVFTNLWRANRSSRIDRVSAFLLTALGSERTSIAFDDISIEQFVASIDIDIRPGDDGNSIQPSSRGVVPVAILGRDSLDVADVDVTTLRFGPDGAAPAHPPGGSFTYDAHVRDVNFDGFPDLVGRYRASDSGIICGQTSAVLMGQLLSGQRIRGFDTIRTIGCTPPPPAGSMIAVGWSFTDSPVYRIDERTGEAQFIGLTGFPGLNSLARNSAGAIYSASENPSSGVAELITIDPLTGAGTSVALLDFGGVAPSVRALAFSPTDVLYAADGMSDALWEIDVSTGVGTKIGGPSFQSLAFSPSGVLYAWAFGTGGTGPGLVIVDPTTGAVTDVSPVDSTVSMQSLAFTPDGRLFGSSPAPFDTEFLWVVDQTDGSISSVGVPLVEDLRGIEFVLSP